MSCAGPAEGGHLCGLDLPGQRMNEGHVGTRFGDAGPGWAITLDGVDVTDQTYEAMAGEKGWVVLYHEHEPRKRHLCHDREACRYIEHGNVQLSKR